MNNGENDLQGCFLSPIRFGKKYLGCIKATILEHTKRGEIATLKDVLIKFEDEDESEREDEYEGYFRLMTKQGIPFGNNSYAYRLRAYPKIKFDEQKSAYAKR